MKKNIVIFHKHLTKYYATMKIKVLKMFFYLCAFLSVYLYTYLCICHLSVYLSSYLGAWVLRPFSQVRLCVTQWTVACQAPLSMGFSRQGYWSGLPCPPPGDLSNPGIKPTFLSSPALTGVFFTTSAAWEALDYTYGSGQSTLFLFLGKAWRWNRKRRSAAWRLPGLTFSETSLQDDHSLWLLLASMKTFFGLWSLAPESFGSALDHSVGRRVTSCLDSSNSPENIWPLMLLSRNTGRRRERERKRGGMCIEK